MTKEQLDAKENECSTLSLNLKDANKTIEETKKLLECSKLSEQMQALAIQQLNQEKSDLQASLHTTSKQLEEQTREKEQFKNSYE